ncbi:MAG TPA: hypothetical protein VF165_02160 [Nocardioidaceae bacterium]
MRSADFSRPGAQVVLQYFQFLRLSKDGFQPGLRGVRGCHRLPNRRRAALCFLVGAALLLPEGSKART